MVSCRHQYRREHAVNRTLGAAMVFFAFLYMTEKWGLFFDRNKQVQGVDSNSKVIYELQPNIEE
jgi:hypothetical protein